MGASGHCGGPLRKPPPGLNMLNKVLILLIVYLGWSSSSPSPFKVFRRHSQPSLLPRVGRNSKVMLHPRDSRAKEMVKEDTKAEKKEMNVGEMLKDLERKLAEVKKMEAIDFKAITSKPMKAEDGEDVDPMANDLAEGMMMEAVSISEQKDRELRAKDSNGFDLEHSFSLQDGEEVRRSGNFQQPQQYSSQYQQYQGQQGQFENQYSSRQGLTQYPNQQQGQYRSQQQFQAPSQYQTSGLGQASPRQIEGIRGQPRRGQQPSNPRTGLLNNFGQSMGADAVADPDGNAFPTSPQLSPSRQALEDGLQQEGEEEEQPEEEVRCINKVMQVETTVYEDKVKCQHTFTEKCHDTFITDYIPTQERKCETSFDKNCHITYKPMMFEESVKICNEGLKKVCDNTTVGAGEEVCKTHYETTCETRFKEHGIEQDVPVCEMVTQRKCNGVLVPVPNEEGDEANRLRRQAGEDEVGENSVDSDKDLLSIGEECEEWPVQKCTVQKKVVKKVNPDTSCRKVPREICAPSNCVFTSNEKVCRDETRQLVQNIPSEECDLEPREECRMDTVLVPRLIQKPNCIKVPKEICVNVKANPRKVTKPVVKEWCYKPSDLRTSSTRLALRQFFSN